MSLVEALFFVGIDWAAKVHAVCVLNAAGRKVAAFSIEHTAAGFAKLAARLAGLAEDPQAVPIAIERPDGRLIDALLEAGHPVVPVKPNAIKAWRDGEVLSGAKSDPGDAEVIAEYLRLRAHKLRPAVPYSDDTKALRTLTRTRGEMVEARVAATNQLAALLDACWPGAKEVFADVASPIALAFLTRYPTPAAAASLGVKRMAAFCAKHGYCGRRSPEALLDRLRSAPAGIISPAQTEALRDAVIAHVGVLAALNTALKDLDRSVAAHLADHPDGTIFASFPRAGTINAAQILAEWGDARDAYTGPEAVAALAGLVPVTKKSGKHSAVHFRWACNKRLRVAITTFADNSRHENPWAADIYRRARASGKDHPHAVRILARAWVRVIWRCWQTGIPYDPALHNGAQPALSAAAAA
ncbi:MULTISPECIES: IS110 family transposase [Mycobacterium]|uniref:Transposase n=2 Tax=Mycobacterium TaxID=1763 RepID=A0A1X1Y9D7_9MYCO|nr:MULTISPECIES: IS110 family transposase [Mycobacterium]ORW07641.1 transposase [Mycobacterium kyorinense]PBJ39054.1 IS110 family transposase [Mycobacterium avium subsp. hominissuis]QWY65211.1 IS110 family transposase [Mycobacterium avium subsp. hominissuis]QWY65311.1 IS110 family transposase [Mycobacterium avium subsp. hominissuis]QWY65452.1 IS110 family transposase [Mycobacterium avium subsp. hominissuis]